MKWSVSGTRSIPEVKYKLMRQADPKAFALIRSVASEGICSLPHTISSVHTQRGFHWRHTRARTTLGSRAVLPMIGLNFLVGGC